MGGDLQCRACAEVYDDEEGHDCPWTKGPWRATFAITAPCPNGFWTVDEVGGPGGCEVETRQACSDLIALLERVRERLPP